MEAPLLQSGAAVADGRTIKLHERAHARWNKMGYCCRCCCCCWLWSIGSVVFTFLWGLVVLKPNGSYFANTDAQRLRKLESINASTLVVDLALSVKTTYCPNKEATGQLLEKWGVLQNIDDEITSVEQFSDYSNLAGVRNSVRVVVRRKSCEVLFHGSWGGNEMDNVWVFPRFASSLCGGFPFCGAHAGVYGAWFGFDSWSFLGLFSLTQTSDPHVLHRRVVEYLKRNRCDSKQRVVVSGHSLGASIGTMATIDLARNHNFTNVFAVLFAPYPVLSLFTASVVEAWWGDRIVRVTHRNDAVPHLWTWPGIFGFGYRHVGMEIYYNDKDVFRTPPVLITRPERCIDASVRTVDAILGLLSPFNFEAGRGACKWSYVGDLDFNAHPGGMHCALPPLFSKQLNPRSGASHADLCSCPDATSAQFAKRILLHELQRQVQEDINSTSADWDMIKLGKHPEISRAAILEKHINELRGISRTLGEL